MPDGRRRTRTRRPPACVARRYRVRARASVWSSGPRRRVRRRATGARCAREPAPRLALLRAVRARRPRNTRLRMATPGPVPAGHEPRVHARGDGAQVGGAARVRDPGATTDRSYRAGSTRPRPSGSRRSRHATHRSRSCGRTTTRSSASPNRASNGAPWTGCCALLSRARDGSTSVPSRNGPPFLVTAGSGHSP